MNPDDNSEPNEGPGTGETSAVSREIDAPNEGDE